MFKVFNKILKKENTTDEDLKKVQDWPLLHWLAGHPVGVQFAQIFNQYDNIPTKQKVDFLKLAMPNSVKFIKYPKKNKDQDKYVDLLCKHFCINRVRAREYYDLLTVDELMELEEQYKEGGFKR